MKKVQYRVKTDNQESQEKSKNTEQPRHRKQSNENPNQKYNRQQQQNQQKQVYRVKQEGEDNNNNNQKKKQDQDDKDKGNQRRQQSQRGSRQQRYNKQDQKKGPKSRQDQKFQNYLNHKQVQKGLEEKTLFRGLFLAREDMRRFATIKCEDFPISIQVNSQEDQNRALHQSTVIFRLKDEEEKELMKREKQIHDYKKKVAATNEDGKRPKVAYILRKEEKKKEEVEEEVKKENTEQEEPKKEERQVGEVVFIEENPWYTRGIVGKVRKQRVLDKTDGVSDNEDEEQKQESNNQKEDLKKKDKKKYLKLNGYWFHPMNKRLPVMYINKVDSELQFETEEEVESLYFVAQITEWTQYTFHPDAKLVKQIGKIGNIEVECQALLNVNQIEEQDFTEETMEYLDKTFGSQLDENGEFIIPDEERKKRMDLTNKIICTIDPKTAKDLDDALSIEKISEDKYEVGVHIADVSYFVREDSPLEEEAILRTTSVYLTHRVIPMLPRLLCENLCSLNPDVERLAFSIFFEMDKDGVIDFKKGVRFGKSIIKSCAKMAYETAQSIIDGTYKSVEEVPQELLPSSQVNQKQWFENIKNMNILAKLRKKQREDKGAFNLFERQKLSFELDEELWPVKYRVQERKDAHKMIEEFMVIANEIAAQQVIEVDRTSAVIRSHAYTSVEKQEKFLQDISQFIKGVDFDFTNQLTLRDSLNKMDESVEFSKNQKLLVHYYIIKLMETAEYRLTETSNEQSWYHHGLQVPYYTHFTSPIRRYPDILSHRLLYKISESRQNFGEELNREELKIMMTSCNEKKLNAKRVSDGSSKIFMCLYLKTHKIETNAIVTRVHDKFIGLVVPDYDIDKEVKWQSLKSVVNVNLKQLQDDTQELVVTYRQENEDNVVIQSSFTVKSLDDMKILLTATNTFPIDYKIRLLIPNKEKNQYLVLK